MKRKRMFRRSGDFWVYMLECGDGTYYTGYTNDLVKRFELHSTGNGAKYTRMRAPVRLVWSKKYAYYRLAVKEEARIKTLTRKKKDEMVAGYKAEMMIDKPFPKREGKNRIIQ